MTSFLTPQPPEGLGPDRTIRWLASQQHDAVSRQQLRSAGLSLHQIDGRVTRGVLARVHRGVYVLTATPLDPLTRFAAALLASERDAVISHRSAAYLHGMFPDDRGPVHLTGPQASRPLAGTVRHRFAVAPDAVTVRERLPCTTVARTLVDIAHSLGPAGLRRAWTTLAGRRMLDVHAVQREVDRRPFRPGNVAVRLLLADHRATVSGTTRSNLETRAVELCRRHGLPMPAVNALVTADGSTFEADLLWSAQRVIVDVDSWRTHGHATNFRSDRQRDFILQAAGWHVVRLLEHDIIDHPARTAARLRELLARRTPGAGV